MNNTAQIITPYDLKEFEIVKKLSTHDAQELLNISLTSKLSAGTPIFRREDQDKQMFYLISGEVELETDSHGTRIIRAGTPAARHPLGCHLPNQLAATAHSDCTLLSFDADMLDLFLSWTAPSNANYQVNEVTSVSDVKQTANLLRSRGLLRFSEDHIQALLNRMQEIHLNAGEVVIRQDGDDDNYYILKSGRASVSRQPAPELAPVKLAELAAGDAFGEEALLANAPRSATITMEESGTVMALSKKDFSELLATPFLNTVSWEECDAMLGLGAAMVDVRLPDEFEHHRAPGSVNVPLAVLRLKLKRFDKNRKYILVCEDGSRASVAAFLMNRHGFNAHTVDGGLNAAPSITGPGITPPKATPAPKAVTPDPVKAEVAPIPATPKDQWGHIEHDDDLFRMPAKSCSTDKTKPFVSKLNPLNPGVERERRHTSAGVKPMAFTAAPSVAAKPVTKPATTTAAPRKARWGMILAGTVALITLPPLAQIGTYTLGSLFSNTSVTAPAAIDSLEPVILETSTVTVTPATITPVTSAPRAANAAVTAPVAIASTDVHNVVAAPLATDNSIADFGDAEFAAGEPQIIVAAPMQTAPLDPATRGLAH